MKELLVFILLFVSTQSSCAGFLYDAFIDSLNSDSELLQLDQVYGYYDESKFVDSFISAVPLVQYYKTELLKASVPAYYSIIPIIESRNIRGSISYAGAGGVWQLMPSCIDPAVSAQFKLLKHMPRQGFSFSALGEGAGGYRSRSNPRSRDWRAAGSRTGSGARIAP